MNERFFLKLLLILFAGLIAAEVLVVALFGLRIELILLCFIVVAAFTGITFVVRLLQGDRREIESVSMRRARAKNGGIMQERLKDYGVDEEFIGRKPLKRPKENASAPALHEQLNARSTYSAAPVTVTIEEAIRAHAEMYGGLGQLLQLIEKIDDASFGLLVQKAGLDNLSREDVMLKITLMVDEASFLRADSGGNDGEKPCILEGHSMDRESFDDYIRRCMTGAGDDPECADKGFSVELDGDALSKGSGVPPADFSHDPKSVIASLKRAGSPS
jgi:hypothetical protein